MATKRFYQIAKVVLQYGLDDLIPKAWLPWYARMGRVSIFWLRNRHKDKSRGERVRLALESLGPVFIKFGQMLSTRRDLIPLDIADELAILQDNVPPFSGEAAEASILKALNIESLDELFTDFDPKPLASASIAQVHTAKLKADSAEVVIKVIRPNIEPIIESDVELLRSIAVVVQRWLPDGKRMRPVEVVEEYQKTIFDELNLVRESTNGMAIKHNGSCVHDHRTIRQFQRSNCVLFNNNCRDALCLNRLKRLFDFINDNRRQTFVRFVQKKNLNVTG